MALVHGPVQSAYPSPLRTPQRIPSTDTIPSTGEYFVCYFCPASNILDQKHQLAASISRQPDPYYGHEQISRLCAKFIYPPFRLPRATPIVLRPYSQAPIFHRIRPLLHQVASFCDICVHHPLAVEGAFSNCTEIVRLIDYSSRLGSHHPW